MPADGVKVIDGTGKLALPGFINTHHHFYQNITRNIPIMQKGNLFGLASLLIRSMGKYGRRGRKGGSTSGYSRAPDDQDVPHLWTLCISSPMENMI